jgi:hypothetical protein
MILNIGSSYFLLLDKNRYPLETNIGEHLNISRILLSYNKKLMWFWNWWGILGIALIVVVLGKLLHMWSKRG